MINLPKTASDFELLERIYVVDYFQAYEMTEEKFILLNTEGGFVDMMWEVNPKHKNNVHV